MAMAAATGYDDGPTDELLRAYADLRYADLPVYGCEIAEVFSVRVPAAAARGNRPPPCGMIQIVGDNCQCPIFRRSLQDDPDSPQACCDSQGNLLLTGPNEIVSALGIVVFGFHLHDGSREFSFEEDCQNCVRMYPTISIYDRPILETVNTHYGPVEVMYAILSQGVEGKVAVRLAHQDGEDPISIFGRIVARSKLFDMGCVLFYNEDDKKICAGSGGQIPLVRHVLAVPLYKPLVIELDLRYSYSGDEIMRGALEFQPLTYGQHMKRLISMSGSEIEVAISWSDYCGYG